MPPSSPAYALVRGLGLWATVAIVVGNVIGTGVFLKARVMACHVETPGQMLAVWLAAGLLALAGALTYAELSAMMPRSGGEYVFIRETYGRLWGFLYGWVRFFVGNTGGLAALASGLAIFLNVALGGGWEASWFVVGGAGIFVDVSALKIVAISAIASVTLINCAAVRVGGRLAVVFTALKVTLLASVGVVAFLLADGSWAHLALTATDGTCEGVDAWARGGAAGFAAAMMAALWAYNGWNEVTYVAGEVRDPKRTLPLALIGGVLTVAAVYLFVNTAYVYVLTPAEIASVPATSSVATAVMSTVLGPRAAGLMAAALVVSVLSTLHVVVLVSARIPHAMASDGLFFRSLAPVSPRTRVPVRALVAQGVWASVLVLSGSFDALTNYAVFSVMIFVALVTSAVFVLRRRLPDAERPYRTWGYPVVPVLVLLTTGWLLVNTLFTSPYESLSGLGLMALGLPAYWWFTRRPAA
jgi:basic amino acid/polyamine antiporter, APA family